MNLIPHTNKINHKNIEVCIKIKARVNSVTVTEPYSCPSLHFLTRIKKMVVTIKKCRSNNFSSSVLYFVLFFPLLLRLHHFLLFPSLLSSVALASVTTSFHQKKNSREPLTTLSSLSQVLFLSFFSLAPRSFRFSRFFTVKNVFCFGRFQVLIVGVSIKVSTGKIIACCVQISHCMFFLRFQLGFMV